MKKEILIHSLSILFFILIVIVVRQWFSLSFWPIIPGIIIGTLLPDIDHLIYVYYLRPYEVTSQRAIYGVQKGELVKTWELLASTRSERKHLILHTALFQTIFIVLSFLIITSSASILGRGIVIAFMLHLVVDQALDIKQSGSLANWFHNFPLLSQIENEVDATNKTRTMVYFFINIAILLILSLVL